MAVSLPAEGGGKFFSGAYAHGPAGSSDPSWCAPEGGCVNCAVAERCCVTGLICRNRGHLRRNEIDQAIQPGSNGGVEYHSTVR